MNSFQNEGTYALYQNYRRESKTMHPQKTIALTANVIVQLTFIDARPTALRKQDFRIEDGGP